MAEDKRLQALLELERRIKTGDPSVANLPAEKRERIEALLKTYREQGIAKPYGGEEKYRVLPKNVSDTITQGVDSYSAMKNALGNFQDDYAGNVAGRLENVGQNVLGTGTPGQAQWWQNVDAMDNIIRNNLFGASLTAGEKAAYERTTVSPGMTPERVKENLGQRMEIIRKAMARQVASAKGNKYEPEAITGLIMGFEKDFSPDYTPPKDQPKLELKFNDEIPKPVGWRATPEQEQKIADFTRSAKSPDEIVAFARGLDVDIDRTDAEKVLNYSKENPDYVPGFDYKKAEEQAKAKVREELGGGNNPLNAAAAGFADTATVGLADKLSAIGQTVFGGGTYGENLAANRAKSEVMAEDNPLSTLAGSVGGLIAGGEAGAMKFPGVARYLSEGSRAARFGKGIAADTLYGAGYGANKADNGDYIGGAMRGAGEAAIGSALGRGVVGAAGAALSPAANASVDFLRSKGVRTTPLQSLGPKGAVVEEKLTSVPVIGSMIGSAKDRASKDFQRGYVNDSLAPIGKEITEEISGTQLMDKAQQAFNDAYAEARAGMRLVPDAELVDALSALDKRLADGEVSEDVYKRLRKIYDAQVGRRLKKGAIDGEDYKAMHSSLGKLMDTAKRSQNFELANGLNEMQAILDTAARKSSPAEAVAKMDAADQGYALFVRAENAAKMRGGETGEFSARQLDSAVQKGDSSVRSKAYLSGDALGQDWAQAGKDILVGGPNSWTVERMLTASVLGGGAGLASAYDPTGVAPWAIGGLAAAYAPGARSAIPKLIAGSRPAQIRQAGDIMVNQARLGSAFTLPYFLSE